MQKEKNYFKGSLKGHSLYYILQIYNFLKLV